MNYPNHFEKDWLAVLQPPMDLTTVREKEVNWNKERVYIYRFQANKALKLGENHTTFITKVIGGELLAYANSFCFEPTLELSPASALEFAREVLLRINYNYAQDLIVDRGTQSTSTHINSEGKKLTFPTYTVYFHHKTKRWSNYVVLAGKGKVVRLETQVRWNLFKTMRKTSQWLDDDWVQQHEKQ